jgi:antitoxin VapB
VKLFKNGRSQAVWIPRDFELPREDAITRKEGTSLVIDPAPPRSLLALLATLKAVEDEFPPEFKKLPGREECPVEPVRPS